MEGGGTWGEEGEGEAGGGEEEDEEEEGIEGGGR